MSRLSDGEDSTGQTVETPMTSTEEQGSDPLIGRTIEGRYEIIDLIGRGGMGAVYRARQLLLDKIMALKVVLPEKGADQQSILRFLHEGKAAMELSHENIVAIRDFGQTNDGVLYLAMDFIEGSSLKEVIKRESPLQIDRIVRIGVQTCDALYHAHNRGVVHRDIKPANILLARNPDGREIVKLFDFGVAKLQFEDLKITKTGALVGTPTYMSPEQVTGSQPNARSDIYSIGCVLFEMLTGKPPFRSEASMDTFLQHVNEPVPKIERSDAPQALIAIINRCLSKEPDQRYTSAKELKEELERSVETPTNDIHEQPRITVFAIAMVAMLIATMFVVANRVTVVQKEAARKESQTAATKNKDSDFETGNSKSLADFRHDFLEGQRALDRGDLGNAEKILQRALTKSFKLANPQFKLGTLEVLIDTYYLQKNESAREKHFDIYKKTLYTDSAHYEQRNIRMAGSEKWHVWKLTPTAPTTLREVEEYCATCNDMAEKRTKRGFLKEALEIVKTASGFTLRFKLSPEVVARTHLNKGILLSAAGKTERATQSLEKAKKLYEDENLKTDRLARTYFYLARAQRLARKFPLAERYAKQAIDLDKSILGPTSLKVAVDLSELAQIYYDDNRKPEAEKLWNEVVQICHSGKAIGAKLDDVQPLLACGRALRSIHKSYQSKQAYERALSITEGAVWKNDHSMLVPILTGLEPALADLGNAEELNCMRNRLQAMNQRNNEVYLFWQKVQKDKPQ